MKTIAPALLVLISLVLTGCSSGEPVRYYLVKPADNLSIGEPSDVKISVIDLEIPQYLERYQIAARRDDNQLVFAASHQWAESLRKNLTRSLARNLTNLLGTAAVGTPASRLTAPADFSVAIYLEQFERGPDGYVHLVARWQLVDVNSRQTLAHASNEYASPNRVDARDFNGTVNAMSELLGELSVTIANKIRENR